jgi:micrococcal nuclease
MTVQPLRRSRHRGRFLLASLFCLFAAGPVSALLQSVPTLTGKVVRVRDGDSLDVSSGRKTLTVRLEGIDAPEMSQPFGREARDHLRVLSFNRTVEIRGTETDQYGRTIARVFVGGRDLSHEMLRSGLAWHFRQYSHDSRLAALEAEARNARRGLWRDARPEPPWEHRAAARTSQQQRGSSPATRPPLEGPFRGNVRSRVYHAPGCSDYNCPNCTQVFQTRRAAEAAGFRPHRSCVK